MRREHVAAAQRRRRGRMANALHFRGVFVANYRRTIHSVTKWIPTRKHCCWLYCFEDAGDENESIDEFKSRCASATSSLRSRDVFATNSLRTRSALRTLAIR
ncbi:hypothetical protein PYW08_009093 [Mythimna loreyi]|uniref:Uncharacterized protein n=1 Tax=Mythimna loreyi TaxID=667449 RepID=A0ACC2Q9G5_9NEOP|nr:hypothetical protein PYW08_009093 [Mythimna loreyi]